MDKQIIDSYPEKILIREARNKIAPEQEEISKLKANSEKKDNSKEVKINPKKKSNKVNTNELFLGILTLLLGITHFVAIKTNLMNFYIMDFGEIDLEMISWGTYNLTLTLKDAVLVGGTLFLGLLFLLTLPKKQEEKEPIEIYIENPPKENISEKEEKAKKELKTQKNPNLIKEAKL